MKKRRQETAECEKCGKPGTRTHGNEKYFHKRCKDAMHKVNMRMSTATRTQKDREERIRYLHKVNGNQNAKRRPCILCRKEFKSKGNHNRVCSKCNCLMDTVLYREPNRHKVHLSLNIDDLILRG